MPANTSKGYPYPLPTEPVAEGAQAIRNLADANNAHAPWVDIQVFKTANLAASGDGWIYTIFPRDFVGGAPQILLVSVDAASSAWGPPAPVQAVNGHDWKVFVGGGKSCILHVIAIKLT